MMIFADTCGSMNLMNASTATMSHSRLSEAATPWAGSLKIDTYEVVLGRDTQGWSLLRLVLAAGLTVLALGIIVMLLP
jgi:hypothetical protein